jgi:hypothetical protein
MCPEAKRLASRQKTGCIQKRSAIKYGHESRRLPVLVSILAPTHIRSEGRFCNQQKRKKRFDPLAPSGFFIFRPEKRKEKKK